MDTKYLENIVLGGGCFWCSEAVFKALKGVESAVSGYSGGTVPGTPTYKEVCSGLTGHAEVVQVTFDPKTIALEDVLKIFFTTHDPTTLNRQGGDVGTQYRSVVFYKDEAQKATAKKIKTEMQSHFDDSVVTEISPLKTFYKAEDEHQDYFANNADTNPYCNAVISPKLAKFRELYAGKLK